MKRIYAASCLTITLLAFGCSKDLGNYNYAPNEEIKIEGVASSYTRISGQESINIDPVISSSDGSVDFDCFWGIYENDVSGDIPPTLDTLSKTKKLDYLVKQRAKNWTLVFCAKNKKSGYSKYINVPLYVVTPSSSGWYVLKDDGAQSDIDLFKTPTTIVPSGEKVENIYSFYNGKKIDGKAGLFTFLTSYKSFDNGGVIGNTRTLFSLTDKEVSAISINSFKEIRNFNGLFYTAPATKAPGFVTLTADGEYMQNDGQLYNVVSNAANTGLFGAKKLKDAQNSPYKLSKYFISAYGFPFGQGPYFFDDLSSSFLAMSSSSVNTFTAVTDIAPVGGVPQTAMSAKNNNKTLLFMGINTNLPTYGGYAYFQDKTNPNLKILSNLTLSLTAFKMVNDTVKTTDKFFNAKNIALLQGDESLVYFANGNEVWSRNLANKFEQLQYTVPAGEQITFIRHRKYSGTGVDATKSYNYVMIGTKIGSNYKVRMFTKTSGNLSASPAFTLDGTGSVGDVIFISASVIESTYNSTY